MGILLGFAITLTAVVGGLFSFILFVAALVTQKGLLMKISSSLFILCISPKLAFIILGQIEYFNHQKFISAADGSVGPAFYAFLGFIALINTVANLIIWLLLRTSKKYEKNS